jgi:hypothetical protein
VFLPAKSAGYRGDGRGPKRTPRPWGLARGPQVRGLAVDSPGARTCRLSKAPELGEEGPGGSLLNSGSRQAIAVLRKRNIEVAPLLQHVGLSERDLDNRQGRISANAQAKLLECAADALGDSAFGLHLAQQANLREAGLLFYVTSAARTIGETLRFMNAIVGSSMKRCE